MLGAARVIAIDRLPERLEMARSIGAITVDYSEQDVDVLTALKDLTAGTGPDSCIDAVGLEAHLAGLQGVYDAVKTTLMMETDRPIVLSLAISENAFEADDLPLMEGLGELRELPPP